MGGHRVIDHVLLLMSSSDFYCRYSVEQVVRTIFPPLHLKQHTGIVENGRLVAWCSWAFMSEDKKQQFMTAEYRVQPADWRSGKELVFMDFIAPYGHARQLCRDVRGLFQNYEGAVWLRRPKNNRQVEVKNGR